MRPPAIGMGEALGAIAEKICLTGEREQALFRRRMRFDRAIGPEMAKRQSARGQRPADQQAAMAVERFALGAKQAHAMVRHFIHDAFEPGRELRAGGHGLVVGDAVDGNRALAFVVHLLPDARALMVERGLEDASWRMPWVALPA